MPSKSGTLSIIVVVAAKFTEEFDADAKPAKYRADFSVAEIPEDGELRTDLPAGRILAEGETVEEEEMVMNLKIKVSSFLVLSLSVFWLHCKDVGTISLTHKLPRPLSRFLWTMCPLCWPPRTSC